MQYNNRRKSKRGDKNEPERIEAMCGGKGHVLIKHILGEKEMNGKCGLYAEVTLEPGCSLGYHEHHGEVRRITS